LTGYRSRSQTQSTDASKEIHGGEPEVFLGPPWTRRSAETDALFSSLGCQGFDLGLIETMEGRPALDLFGNAKAVRRPAWDRSVCHALGRQLVQIAGPLGGVEGRLGE
jgi:hypothetical protein